MGNIYSPIRSLIVYQLGPTSGMWGPVWNGIIGKKLVGIMNNSKEQWQLNNKRLKGVK